MVIPNHSGRGVFSGQLYQEGGSLAGFAGPEYQTGGGWNFGSFLWRHAKPLLGFLAREGLKSTPAIAQDIAEGKSIKSALKRGGKNIAISALDKAKDKVSQVGTGKRRPRRRTISRRRKTRVKPSLGIKRRRMTRRSTDNSKRKSTSKRRIRRHRSANLRKLNEIFQ